MLLYKQFLKPLGNDFRTVVYVHVVYSFEL